MKCPNIVTGIFNLIITFYSILYLVGGARRLSGPTACSHSQGRLFIAIGTVLLVFSIAGYIGACYRVKWILRIYMLVLVLLILLGFGSEIFVFVVTSKGDGESISGKTYKEYRLHYYSTYMQNMVNKGWNTTRGCLVDANLCKRLINIRRITATQFYAKNLSPRESGCCKPSNDCGFEFVTPTNWTKPTRTSTYSNQDCTKWNNDKSVLCYDCDAWKAGEVHSIKGHMEERRDHHQP